MFNPSRDEARRFFFDAWRKFKNREILSGLEDRAVAVMLDHPEYHALLDDPERHAQRDYPPEAGETNPFLHLSLHLAVREQLAINQPPGIAAHYARLSAAHSPHEAQHALLECLAETVWRAQRDHAAPDEAAYLECLEKRK